MRLVIQSGNQFGQTLDLTRDYYSIGRDTNNDLILADSAVSRRHCQIRREPGGWIIYDMGGVNGTRVNGEKIIAPRPLREGDTITLGQTTLRVEPGEPTTSPGFQSPMIDMAQPQYAPAPSQSNLGLWIGVVVAVLLVIVIGIVALYVLTTPAPPPPQTIAAPTVTLVAIAPTATIALAQPTIAATATVTAPIALANTPTPTGGGEKTRTPVPTFTPSPTPDKSFPAVSLMKPKLNEKISTSDAVEFNWTDVGVLRDRDVYRLQIVALAPEFDDPLKAILVCEVRTQRSFIAVTGKSQDCNDRWQFNRDLVYFWRVQVVVPDPNGMYKVISTEPAQISSFYWAP